jgi:hypothetical protein
MSEYLPKCGDTVRDLNGINHIVIRCVPGDCCTWVKVDTVGDLGYLMQYPVDELTFVHEQAVA